MTISEVLNLLSNSDSSSNRNGSVSRHDSDEKSSLPHSEMLAGQEENHHPTTGRKHSPTPSNVNNSNGTASPPSTFNEANNLPNRKIKTRRFKNTLPKIKTNSTKKRRREPNASPSDGHMHRHHRNISSSPQQKAVSGSTNRKSSSPTAELISSVATRQRSTSMHLSTYYNDIQNQIQQENTYPRSRQELWSSLGSFMGNLVPRFDIQLGLERLDELEFVQKIHAYVCQNVPVDLLLFQKYIEESMHIEETVEKLQIAPRVCDYLKQQLSRGKRKTSGQVTSPAVGGSVTTQQTCSPISQTPSPTTQTRSPITTEASPRTPSLKRSRKRVQRDLLLQYHLGILIRCTMMSSTDFQRFCSKGDIRRRQLIIQKLGFRCVWRIIRKRAVGPRHLMESDSLLHAALFLLLRLTISTVNLETVREYSANYYNVGQSGVDGAIIFAEYIQLHEDKRRFWHIIDLLLGCNHTRLMTLYILFNIALFRRSISSIIGHMSLFKKLGLLMLDESKQPISCARAAMHKIALIETTPEVFEHISVGSPIYVISRGIASCNQIVYDKYFEKLVWNDVFLKRILQWGEVADAQCISNIARVLYSIAFRTTLKSEEYRLRFSAHLLENYEGFSNIITHIVSQDTEVKIHSLLLLLSTVGYCENRYHAIFLNFYQQHVLRCKQRQKEIEFHQQEQNHVNNMIAKERLQYFTKLHDHSVEVSHELNHELEQVTENFNQVKKACESSERRRKWYDLGLALPFVLAGIVSFAWIRNSSRSGGGGGD